MLLSLILANVPNDAGFGLGLVLVVALRTTFTPQTTSSSVESADTTNLLLGLVFVTIPFRAWLHVQALGLVAVVSLLLTVWNCDTGALVTGRLLGHTLPSHPAWLHRISPHKSLAGLFGGLLCGTLTWMSLPWFWQCMYRHSLVATSRNDDVMLDVITDCSWYMGLVLSAAALLGDLWESSLKRRYAVKDSGQLLPGHGGVLDRFDSSLVAVLVFQLLWRSRGE